MSPRIASQQRKTSETTVHVTLNLDGTGETDIATGAPFLDHMLKQVAVHGLFDLEVQAVGDLAIDSHHTVEDVAIVFGSTLDQALGERREITRIGSCYVPMDDALALVVIDLSGRAYSVVDAEFTSPMLGNLASTLIPHFFETLAIHARMNLHVRALYGRDGHHKAEAMFKAFGRALSEAVKVDPRRRTTSTKGSLG